MRKIIKPKNNFLIRPHSYPSALLENLQSKIFNSEKIQEQLSLLELIAKETRLQILVVLSLKKSICVGDISSILRLDISATSHQLSLLKKANLITNRKKGRVVYYTLSENLPSLIKILLTEV